MINCMKFITAVGLYALLLMSCSTKDAHFAQVSGVYVGEEEEVEIHLSKVEHGRTAKVATSTIGADGRFGFTYAVEKPGIFVVNVVWKEGQRKVSKDHDLNRYYLSNGASVDIELKEDSYKLISSNCPKNELLTTWNNQVDTVFTYSHGFTYTVTTFENFFPVLPQFTEQAIAFKKTINTGDDEFDELMTLMVETDMNLAALQFLYTPRTKHPNRDVYPDYYDYILEEGTPESDRVLELANGYNYVDRFAMYAIDSSPDKPSYDERFTKAMLSIPNDLLKGYYALEYIKGFRTYNDGYISFKQLAAPYFLNNYLKEEAKNFEMSIQKFDKGEPAFDFAGTDVNGKEHKLSDFKGNVVYVDVWATWCGPCKQQIPALKKLEKQFHGKPVTFLSISVDKPRDRQKWIDFVKKENLKGVQIMADKAFDSDVTKAYRINGIPRFMLFDKAGNIVSIDAPRPSDKTIINQLNSLL